MMTAQPAYDLAGFDITVERNTFMRTLAHCQGVVERRNTVPILANVLLEAHGNILKVTATDLEIAFVETMSAQCMFEGAVTVSAHMLYDIVRKLRDGASIHMRLADNGVLTVSSGRSEFNLSTLSPAEFPLMTSGDMPCKFSIHGAELAQMMDHTRFAMSTEETRYYLNGIYMHSTEDGLMRAVATDGHRLAMSELEVPTGAANMPGVIVSRKTVTELRKLLEDATDEVKVALSDRQISFSIRNSLLVSRLIEGKFPDYERVIPQNNDQILPLNVKEFGDAVDRVSIMSTDKTKTVKIKITTNKLVLTASSADAGKATEEIEIDYKGNPIEVGFNARYILDVTQQMMGDTLELHTHDSSQPVIVKDPANGRAIYVLMPMRV